MKWITAAVMIVLIAGARLTEVWERQGDDVAFMPFILIALSLVVFYAIRREKRT